MHIVAKQKFDELALKKEEGELSSLFLFRVNQVSEFINKGSWRELQSPSALSDMSSS